MITPGLRILDGDIQTSKGVCCCEYADFTYNFNRGFHTKHGLNGSWKQILRLNVLFPAAHECDSIVF